jgi:flavin-dependent dehydrogenase
VRATVVVAADGRRSRLGRRLHPRLGDPSRTGPESWFGLKLHLEDAGTIDGRVELHLFDGGYAGLAPIEAGRVNLCLLVRCAALRAAGSPDRLLAERVLANPAARRSIDSPRPCSRWHSVGPLGFGPRRAAAAGALFVGDSAGTIDPFCGQGVSHALCGAELAAPFAIAAAERGGLDERAARAYQRRWSRALAGTTRRARLLAALFARPAVAAPVLRLLRGPAATLLPHLVAATRAGRIA